MADFNALEALINANIKKNGVQAITGNILNGILRGMVSALGKGYTIAGSVTPSSDPGTMTGPVAYIAYTAGTYTHFGGLEVGQGEVSMLIYNEAEWHKEVLFSLAANATVDGNVGTPEVGVSFVDGLLTFNFRNLKGNPGENGLDGQDGRDGVDGQDGAAAGFGTVTASVDANVGTPGVTVQTSGPNTAKNFAFQFTNLKGETGVTSCVVTVDNTSGTPSCSVSLVGQVLHLDFTGLKGAQGDTGSSVDYPFTIVNNLTTNDATQALSAAMGVELAGQVSQLEAKVTELDEEIFGYSWQDKSSEVGSLGTYKIVAAHNANEGSAIYSATEFRGTDFIPVAGGSKIRISVAGLESTGNAGIAFYDSNKAVLTNQSICYQNEGTANNDIRELTVPSGASYFRTTLNAAVGTTVTYFLYAEGESYNERITNLEDTVIGYDGAIDSLKSGRINALAPTYYNGVRLVDTLTKQRFGKSTTTKIGNFIPVSATTDTITLSSDDAACIENTVVLACKIDGGDYRFVYFSAASGNVITKLYDFGANIDCQDIVEMQSLHDTVQGGGGIHLSPFAYRAMAHDIYNQLQTLSPFSDVFVGGFVAQFCLGAETYLDTLIKDADGNLVCTPILDGVTASQCGMVYKANTPTNGPFYRTFYEISVSNPSGSFVTFPIKSLYPFKGFLRVQLCRVPGSTGTATMKVFDSDTNSLLYTKNIPEYADTFCFDLSGKFFNGVNVKIELPDSASTDIRISSMTLHETYAKLAQIRPINETASVALLGSSNTQFPHLDTAQALCPGDVDNELVVNPLGVSGDGCGYMGKELARISGAAVDNWGKSGEQTAWGLEEIQQIFTYKRYTHIILSLFANDVNTGKSISGIIERVRQMVEYVKGQGCVPIVVMGYGLNSTSSANGYFTFGDSLLEGMDSVFCYTASTKHI